MSSEREIILRQEHPWKTILSAHLLNADMASACIPCHRHWCSSAGFTMIELLVTISIAAIMLTIAIPSFRDFLLNSRRATQTNEFVLALNYAKSEAVKRSETVTVCSRSTDTTCAGSTTWDNGWLVFVDDDGDGTADAGELVLQVRGDLEGGNTLRSGSRLRVTFNSSGFSPNTNDTFNLCDSRGTADGRRIVVSSMGRVNSQAGASACP